MAALTNDRDTPMRAGDLFAYPVAASTRIHAGGLVVLEAGYAKPGRTATGLACVGRAEEAVDNSGGANGALVVPVRRGLFLYANSAAADAVTLADVGADAYIVDDATVAKTSATNTRSKAGTIEDVDALGVWVRI